ncbi:PKD domain-containing protein [Pararhodonellum marinum]|uniref:PKD domain-containing protein n=1 Tax=Pararhodonellum marinum TaxID=2755358 RepID=UPI00188E0B2E|nr:PKD domain-containing protein [Pararhodonellum marinum]
MLWKCGIGIIIALTLVQAIARDFSLEPVRLMAKLVSLSENPSKINIPFNDLDFDFSFPSQDNCAGEPINFVSNVTGGRGPYQYAWEFGNGGTATNANPRYTYNLLGCGEQTFQVKLTVRDADGNSLSKTKPILIKEIPNIGLEDAKPFQDFRNCENNPSAANPDFTVTVNNTSVSNCVTDFTLDWGDGTVLTNLTKDDFPLTHTYKRLGAFNLKLTGKGENGCSATKTYVVANQSNPAGGLATQGSTTGLCAPTLAVPFIINNWKDNPPGTLYLLEFGDGNQQEFEHPLNDDFSDFIVEHIYTTSSCPDRSFTAILNVINACDNTPFTAGNIQVRIPPKAEFFVEDACEGKPVRFRNATEVGFYGPDCLTETVWAWDFGDPESGAANFSSLETPSHIFSKPGNYTVILEASNPCGTTRAEIEVCVSEDLEPEFDLNFSEGCGPLEVQVDNLTQKEGNCGPTEMLWTVGFSPSDCNDSGEWSFTGGTNDKVFEPAFNFVAPGTYTITLQASNSCDTYSKSKTVTVTAPPLVRLTPIADSCGPISINPQAEVTSCGPGESVYKWTFEGGTPESSDQLIPGTVTFETVGLHTVTLEVSNACGTTLESVSFNVGEEPEISAGEDLSICFGESVTLSPTVNRDFSEVSFEWIGEPGNFSSSDPNPSVNPETTTTYFLTVTDAAGCFETDEVTVLVEPAPLISASRMDQVICSGESNQPIEFSTDTGELVSWTAEANGVEGVVLSGSGSIPVQILLNNGDTPTTVVYTAVLSEEEERKCQSTPLVYTIEVNPVPQVDDQSLAICSGESRSFRPSGIPVGTAFTWSAPVGSGFSGGSGQDEPQETIDLSLTNDGDEPVKVSIQVTPLLGNCPGNVFDLDITLNPAPKIDFSLSDQVICSGDEMELVQLSSPVDGAVFSWTAQANGVEGVVLQGQGDTLGGQPFINNTGEPRTVVFEVFATTDGASACSGVPVQYEVTVNPILTLNAETSNFNGFEVSCFGGSDGSIRLDPSGGSGSYRYAWTGPDGFSSDEKDLDNLGPGTYTLELRDAFGCELSRSFELRAPVPFEVSLEDKVDILCAGSSTGVINLQISGGVEGENGYDIQWIKDGTIMDESLASLSELSAGTYEVIATDANGCTISLPPIELTEPDEILLIGVEKGDISCYNANDGFINLQIQGGVGPYKINWDFGSAAQSFDNLGPGTYRVSVTDAIGCVKQEEITVQDAPRFAVDPIAKDISCHGAGDGSIVLNLEFEGPITIRWDHGAELENLFNLQAGSYGVTLRNQDGCEIRRTFFINEPDPLQLSAQVDDALDCGNPQSGAIDLLISGGVPPYEITWNNGSNLQNLANLTSGQYTVSITDQSGCQVSQQYVVKRPDPIQARVFRSLDITCEPRNIFDEFELNIEGGLPPFNINWSGGQVRNNGYGLTVREPGLYQLNITDAMGCEYNESFEVDNHFVALDMDIQSTSLERYQAFFANFPVVFTNNSFGNILSYYWDFGDGNSSTQESPTHIYQEEGEFEVKLQVVDLYGCELEISRMLEIRDYFIKVPNAFTPNEDGINDFFFPKFLSIESLEFYVMNKWGEVIFFTDDLNSPGWDGKINGEPALPGNYVYKMSYRTLDGGKFNESEVFILIK